MAKDIANICDNDNVNEKKNDSWFVEDEQQKVPLCPLQYSILKLFMNVKQVLTWSYSQDEIDDDDIDDNDIDDSDTDDDDIDDTDIYHEDIDDYQDFYLECVRVIRPCVKLMVATFVPL